MVKLTKKLSGIFPIFQILGSHFCKCLFKVLQCCCLVRKWACALQDLRIFLVQAQPSTFYIPLDQALKWFAFLYAVRLNTTFDQVHLGLIHGAAVAGHESGKGAAKTAGYIFHGWGFVEVNTDRSNRVVSSNQKQWFLVGCPWKSATSYLFLRDVSNLLIQGWNSPFSKYQQDIPVVSSKNCMESFKNVVGHMAILRISFYWLSPPKKKTINKSHVYDILTSPQTNLAPNKQLLGKKNKHLPELSLEVPKLHSPPVKRPRSPKKENKNQTTNPWCFRCETACG